MGNAKENLSLKDLLSRLDRIRKQASGLGQRLADARKALDRIMLKLENGK